MKILMLTDSLNIGGAETHVETLAVELYKMGHEVAVASSGGEIAKRMSSSGIRHLFLPMPKQLALSSELVGKYIERERPDVVHAHTRRCALIALAPCKKAKIPLITTAHALFSMRFPKNLISRWGDATISVSSDIKDHLVRHTNLISPQIEVIHNGVALPTNTKIHTDCNTGKPKILFVSRLDEDSSLGAHLLCDIAEDLAKKYRDLSITIVGGGAEHPKIAQKASKVNSKLNRKLINAVGLIQNPSDLISANTLFVGVSRAALEAMAHGTPVILLGNEGYLGLFDEKKLQRAKSTNFTCRSANCSPSKPICSKKELYSEICRYLDMTDGEKKRLSALSQRVIAEEYSAEIMAKSTLNFYKKALNSYYSLKKHRKKIVLCGYYGHGNLGDEIILSEICTGISHIGQNRINIEILRGKNPISNIKKLIFADAFIFGGGSLLQNATSNASLIYYLALILLARLLSKKTAMLSNGIGPIYDGILCENTWKRLISLSVRGMDFISVRDSISQENLKEMKINKKIHLVPDPALLYFERNRQKINYRLINAKSEENKSGYFLFFPCTRTSKREGYTKKVLTNTILELSDLLSASVKIVVLNKNEDEINAKIIQKELMANKIHSKAEQGEAAASDFYTEAVIPKNADELVELILGAKLSISQRYHGALFSLACGIPTVAISRDPKLKALFHDLGIRGPRMISMPTEAKSIKKYVLDAIKEQNSNQISIKKRIKSLEKRAQSSFSSAMKKIL